MITIANANALYIPLPDESVQCIVTSPPYWGLRDYGTAKWEGGSEECDHKIDRSAGIASSTLQGGKKTTNHQQEGNYTICPRCGARRIDAQIGLESTPAEYVAHIVAVMRECWRVLRPSGVLFLNLGDSYFGDSPTRNSSAESFSETWDKSQTRSRGGNRRSAASVDGLKLKDLCGIPWRVAFALQDAGWYLRSDIIWHKPNPMPESVTDRPTKSHEYVFLLTKQARYYYDAEAIKDPIAEVSIERAKYGFESSKRSRANSHPSPSSDYMIADQLVSESGMRNKRSVWTVATSPYSGAHFATFPPALIEPMILAGTSARGECPHCGKAWVRVVETMGETNRQKSDRLGFSAKNPGAQGINVAGGHGDNSQRQSTTIGWLPDCACYGYTIPQLPDMPDDVKPPNLCEECGGTGVIVFDDLFGRQEQLCQYCDGTGGDQATPEWIEYQTELETVQAERRALLAKIDQHAVTVPQLVLDPFAGSGTTGQVAVKHGRRAVLLDLNTKYIDLQFERTNGVQVTMPL